MLPATDHEDVAADLALYAIGAVTDAERSAIEAHVAGCETCQTELQRLGDAAALLAPVERRALDACWDRIVDSLRGPRVRPEPAS